jgi:hypothetical protein
MEGFSALRLLTVAGLVITVITGLAAIVDWIASTKPAVDVLSKAAQFAGSLGLGYVTLMALILLPVTRWVWERVVFISVLALGVVGMYALVIRWEERALQWIGIPVLALGLLTIAQIVVDEKIAARQKICPDCAETVKQAAKLCKHCGHRFADQGAR